ncbi:MAG: tryptophan--tRNA ligase [Candidatus Altiarchaeota archaeon]
MVELNPWASADIEDYQKLLEEFGIESFEKFRAKFGGNRYIRRGIIFGHRDFGRIAEAMERRKPYAMMTGLMPSGKFHFGHKMVADEIIWFQEKGAEIFVCAADVESWLMRDVPFEEAKRIAIEEYLENYIALGLKPKGVTFWFQSDYRNEYYRLRDMAAKRVTFNEMKAIYGDLTPGKIVSSLAQVADILHPQLKELGGLKPVVVPVGADQDPHIRLTRDIASRLNAYRMGPHGTVVNKEGKKTEIPLKDAEVRQDFPCIPPSATYHKFMHGLQGGKMSSSDPKSYIALTDSPDAAKKKIMGSQTGGRTTVEEQKRLGGEPEKCRIYEMYMYHLVEDDAKLSRIYNECRSGSILCGECKTRCAGLMEKFLNEHQIRREKAKAQAKNFLG